MADGWIPLSTPNFHGNEKKYVDEAIEAEWVSTAGAFINRFEEQIAARLSVRQACACQSGTAGLHLCLRHFGVSLGDLVLVPTLTFQPGASTQSRLRRTWNTNAARKAAGRWKSPRAKP